MFTIAVEGPRVELIELQMLNQCQSDGLTLKFRFAMHIFNYSHLNKETKAQRTGSHNPQAGAGT